MGQGDFGQTEIFDEEHRISGSWSAWDKNFESNLEIKV